MTAHLLPFRPMSDEALEAAIKSLSQRTIAAYDAGDKQLARESDKRRMLAIRLRSELHRLCVQSSSGDTCNG